MEVQGKVVKVLEAQSGVSASSGKDWTKQDFVIETFGEYPKQICMTDFNNKVQSDSLLVGQEVTASINIESREYNDRWYTNVNVYKLEKN